MGEKERYIKQPIFDHQQFLSDDGSFIQAKCELELYYYDDLRTKLEWVSPQAILKLSNGDRVFNFYTESFNSDARQTSINTIEKVIAVLEQFKAAFIYLDEQTTVLEAEADKNNKVTEEVVEPINE